MLKTRKAGDTEELVAPLIIAVSDFMDNDAWRVMRQNKPHGNPCIVISILFSGVLPT